MQREAKDTTKTSPAWHIAVISFFILTLELALIRQVPAEVRAIGYFSNLLLMATFLGLGLGCILQRWRGLMWLVPVGLAGIAAFVWFARGIVIHEEATGIHYWLQYTNLPKTALRLPLFPAAVLAFMATAVPFVGLGQNLARTMDARERLPAYGWDIAGSLAGTAAFAVGSYLEVPPWVWVPVGACIWSLTVVRKRWMQLVTIAASMAFLLFAQSDQPTRWSPYYHVQHRVEPSGIRVWVNSSFHQLGIDFRSDDERLKVMGREVMAKFSVPYDQYRLLHDGQSPRRVLILGAGTGNDVQVALHNGAEHVTAVEIDPVIQSLGREHNTSRPFQDERVRTVLDDARHYLWTCNEKFDLIVFGTLDSQTLLSGQANLRLENYVYTAESFADVKAALASDGMFAAYYSIWKPWLLKRLLATASDAFGERLRFMVLKDAFLFNTIIMGAPNDERFRLDSVVMNDLESELTATDDWPFLYLEKPTISPLYLKLFAVLVVLIAGAFFVVRKQHPVSGLHTNFLLLGVGFTLMQTAAIVRLALLFGATWVTNVLVIFACLATIWLSNWMTMRGKAPSLNMAWAGVLLGIGVNFALPLQWLFALDVPVRVLLLMGLVGLPVYFAGVCFSRLFDKQSLTGAALGMNLVGAMAGGLLEYSSMVVGMRAIWLLAFAIYLSAVLATRMADRASSKTEARN